MFIGNSRLKGQSYGKSSEGQKESHSFFIPRPSNFGEAKVTESRAKDKKNPILFLFRGQVTSAKPKLRKKIEERALFAIALLFSYYLVGLFIKKSYFCNTKLINNMAQIKCPHCGHTISDKAPKCIYCGANVVRMQKCSDCGFEYPEKAAACPSCGCPSSMKTKPYASEIERDADRFMLDNRNNFPVYRYNEIRAWLSTLNDRQMDMIYHLDYRETWVMLLVSIFLGYLGVDRFLLRDVKMGLVKLSLSALSFLIIPGLISIVLWLLDIFKIDALTKEYNYNEMRKAASFV